MNKINRSIMGICILTFGLVCIAASGANGETGQLSKSRYSDPKGYFKIVPPDGWRLQEFLKDLRGKVAFFSPDSNADLRVLVNAVDFNTVEDLIAFCKDVESRIGTSTNIQKMTFGGRPAVKRTFQMKGQKLNYIDFLVGNVDHNIAYSAMQSSYDKYLLIAMKSIETYTPIQRDISDKDMIKHSVAKSLRLAQLMIETGNLDLAREFVKEGLSLDPSNKDLLAIEKTLQTKKGR
jgi:hypothetical protein